MAQEDSILHFAALNATSSEECNKLHLRLLDLSTSLRFIGRLATLFTDDVNFKSRLEQGQSLMER